MKTIFLSLAIGMATTLFLCLLFAITIFPFVVFLEQLNPNWLWMYLLAPVIYFSKDVYEYLKKEERGRIRKIKPKKAK